MAMKNSDIDEARRLAARDRSEHSTWERFRCQMRGHRGPDGVTVASHTYTGKNEAGTVTFETKPICDLCGATLPKPCPYCGRSN